jgi:ribosome biogenesis GTPase
MELEALGFSQWFRKELKNSLLSDCSLARVTAAHRDNYIIRNEDGEVPAEVTGKLMYEAQSSLDLPAVGDWVYVQYFNENTLGIIHEILPRKSLLKRKIAGKKIEHQPIASNIDIAFIVQSVEFDFNLPRLERYLTMANDSHIKPVILLSKRDLITQKDLNEKIEKVRRTNPGYEVVAYSSKTGEGIEDIQKWLTQGMTSCLLGSSGVGKTTLINHLLGKDIYATTSVRNKDGKGRHITASRQLIILEKGGLIIDTPGMRELGNIGVETGVHKTFVDIINLAQGCRFKNCTHTDEPDCAVVKAVKNGSLPAKRYENYLKIRRESEFHAMSYLEKRKKDKKFGKMCKDAMKNRKNRLDHL